MLTTKDKERIIYGLTMRICMIETGNPMMRASDVIRQIEDMKRDKYSRMDNLPTLNALSSEQMREIIAHEDLIKKIVEMK